LNEREEFMQETQHTLLYSIQYSDIESVI